MACGPPKLDSLWERKFARLRCVARIIASLDDWGVVAETLNWHSHHPASKEQAAEKKAAKKCEPLFITTKHHPDTVVNFMYFLFKSGFLAAKIKNNISLQIDGEKTAFRGLELLHWTLTTTWREPFMVQWAEREHRIPKEQFRSGMCLVSPHEMDCPCLMDIFRTIYFWIHWSLFYPNQQCVWFFY